MTSPDDTIADSTGRSKITISPDGGYEWTCPFCGMSRLNSSDGEAGLKNAVAALRTHIVASDGAEHGPRNEMPADELTLSEYVVGKGGRR